MDARRWGSRFHKQLIAGFAMLVLMTVMAAAAAIVGSRVLAEEVGELSSVEMPRLLEVKRLRLLAEQVVAASRGYLLTGDAEIHARFTGATEAIEDSLAALDRTGVARAEIAALERDVRSYLTIARSAAKLRATTTDPQDVLDTFAQQLATARAALVTSLEDFLTKTRDRFERGSRRTHAFIGRSEAIVVTLALAIVGLSVALAYLFSRRLRQQYEDAQRATARARDAVRARDEILAIVSHDLRAPLNAITLCADLLESELGATPVGDRIRPIRRAADIMQKLIAELLDTAKLDTGAPELRLEAVDTADLADIIDAMFRDQARRLDVRLEVRAERMTTTLDRARIIQVLSNLVANALRHTPAGRAVTVAITVEAAVVRFAVADEGPGIAADHMPFLFDRYWRAPGRERGSLGLGLHICKHLVAAHAGRIGVDSEPGRGATFWFELPRTLPVAAAPSAEAGRRTLHD